MTKLAIVVNAPSNSGRSLAKELGVVRIRPERVRGRRLFINWGCKNPLTGNVLNSPQAVTVGSNKIESFNRLNGKDYVPEWTQDRDRAREMAARSKILGRSTATGSAGAGITIVDKGGEIPQSLFYVKYIKKQAEYRFHVVRGEVIFRQQKRRKNGVEQTREQSLIRNHDNGWVFAENDVTFPSEAVENRLGEVALDAVRTIGLDFAAVDLIVERETNRVFFLEVNTRPGIESTRLLQEYSRAFRRIASAGDRSDR